MRWGGPYLFGGVLLVGGVGGAELVAGGVAVLLLLHLVDPDQPVLRGERLLQVLQLDVLVADLCVTRAVEAWRRAEVQLRGEERERERARERESEREREKREYRGRMML